MTVIMIVDKQDITSESSISECNAEPPGKVQDVSNKDSPVKSTKKMTKIMRKMGARRVKRIIKPLIQSDNS